MENAWHIIWVISRGFGLSPNKVVTADDLFLNMRNPGRTVRIDPVDGLEPQLVLLLVLHFREWEEPNDWMISSFVIVAAGDAAVPSATFLVLLELASLESLEDAGHKIWIVLCRLGLPLNKVLAADDLFQSRGPR